MRNRKSLLLPLSCLLMVMAGMGLPAVGDCPDNPTGPCCEYFPDTHKIAVGSEDYCAGFGAGCWECVSPNGGGGFERCISTEEPCDPGDEPSGFPTQQI